MRDAAGQALEVAAVELLVTAVPERAVPQHSTTFTTSAPDGTHQPVDTEDVALVVFETDAGGIGSLVVSQISPGRKNRLWFELDGETAAVVFDQELPESLWIGRRDRAVVVSRDRAHLAPEAARLAVLPAGHGQGYHDCFDLFVADAYAAIRGEAPDGLPLIEAGVRACRITDAVLASADSQTWTEVLTT